MAFVNPVPAESAPAARRPPWWPAVTIVAAIVLAYAGTLRAPFLFDDAPAVLRNPTIRQFWSWDVLRPPADGGPSTGRPLVNASFALNYAISGERPWSYHVLNLAIHALAALTLLGIVRRSLYGRRPSAWADRGAGWAAFLIALLWALHPLQTEAVTCVAQRTESLCGLFYLITLYGFARAVAAGANTRFWLIVSLLACFAGMATKEIMVTAPVIILLYDRTSVAGGFLAALRARRVYYAGLAGSWLLLAGLVLAGGGARGASAGFGLGISPWHYLLTQCDAIVRYLRLSWWPDPLVLDYGTAVVQSPGAVWWQGLLLLGLVAATVAAVRRRPAVGFAAASFFLLLAPSSSVVPLVTQTVAEHRMYLPLAPLLCLIVIAVERLNRRALWLFFPVAIGFAGLTIARNDDYRSAVAIWSDNVAKNPGGARGQNNLAQALVDEGNASAADIHFARAVALDPGYVTAHYDWGVALLAQHRTTEAIRELELAARLAPRHSDALVNLGNALLQAQRAPDAIARYEQALQIAAEPDVHYDLGVALASIGRKDEAAAHFRAALALDSHLAEAHFQLAQIAAEGGRLREAADGYTRTLQLDSGHLRAHRAFGLLLARSNRLADAAPHFEAVLRVQPDDVEAHANLGNVLLLAGRPAEAIPHYEAVLRLRPDDARARENLELARAALR